jgi:mycofactocin precursor
MGGSIDPEPKAERATDIALRREEELESELDELLVEEISIDGMCGVY